MPGGRVPAQLTMAVGDFEELAQCGRAAGTADNCGFPITFRTYSGGHDADCWWAAMLLDDLAADTRQDTLPDDTDTGC